MNASTYDPLLHSSWKQRTELLTKVPTQAPSSQQMERICGLVQESHRTTDPAAYTARLHCIRWMGTWARVSTQVPQVLMETYRHRWSTLRTEERTLYTEAILASASCTLPYIWNALPNAETPLRMMYLQLLESMEPTLLDSVELFYSWLQHEHVETRCAALRLLSRIAPEDPQLQKIASSWLTTSSSMRSAALCALRWMGTYTHAVLHDVLRQTQDTPQLWKTELHQLALAVAPLPTNWLPFVVYALENSHTKIEHWLELLFHIDETPDTLLSTMLEDKEELPEYTTELLPWIFRVYSSSNDWFAWLRTLFMGPVCRRRALGIRAFLKHWPSDETREIALQQSNDYLQEWPPLYRAIVGISSLQ